MEAVEQLRRLERSYVKGPKLDGNSARLANRVAYVGGRDRTDWSGGWKQGRFWSLISEATKLWGRGDGQKIDANVGKSGHEGAGWAGAVRVRGGGVDGGGLDRIDGVVSGMVGGGAEAVQGGEQQRQQSGDRWGGNDGDIGGQEEEQEHGTVEMHHWYGEEQREARAAALLGGVDAAVLEGEEGVGRLEAEGCPEQRDGGYEEEAGGCLPIHGRNIPGRLEDQGQGTTKPQVNVYR